MMIAAAFTVGGLMASHAQPSSQAKPAASLAEEAVLPYVDSRGKMRIRRFVRVYAEEIRKQFMGMAVTEDPNYSKPDPFWGEIFYENGSWKRSEEQFGMVGLSGFWEIKNDELCKYSKTIVERCRKIWRFPYSNRILMSDGFRSNDNVLVILRSEKLTLKSDKN
jgi:hypothetical protein